MDSTIGISLVATKFTHISAEIGNNNLKGGSLAVQVENKVKEGSEASQILGEITINVTGLPKSPTNEKEFAFKLLVKVAGVFKRKDTTEVIDLKKSENLKMALSQPLYAMGIVEVGALGQKLGFSNIDLPWDIQTISGLSTQHTTNSQAANKTKPVAKTRNKKLTPPKD